MPRDAALVITWGGPVVGREAQSLQAFMDFMTFVGKKAADGKVSQPEVFFASDGSNGMAIIKGRSDDLQEVWESDENERLLTKAHAVVNEIKAHTYYTGETETQRIMQMFAEVGNEMGLL